MDTDDLEPIKKKPVKKDLSRMSIGDLREYIAELKAEIVRAEQAIAHKDRARQGAEGFFKS
ncbi:MAG: DUF1192 domain-containing protein [Rhodospirillaceae bacterium]|nr:MAG: DUF1192 domain-containing protein [Rhodospirillaceae bacterium]